MYCVKYVLRQNGSSELTLMGCSRTRLIGLGDGLVSETRSIDPLGNETVACSYLDRATHTTTRTVTTPASSLAAEVLKAAENAAGERRT